MTPNKRKHFGESWVVLSNQERDRQQQIESRERHEKLLDEYRVYELTADLPIHDPDPVSVIKESEKGLDRDEPNV